MGLCGDGVMIVTTDDLQPGDVLVHGIMGPETVRSVEKLGEVMRHISVERHSDGEWRTHTVAREATHRITRDDTRAKPPVEETGNAVMSRRIIRRIDPRPAVWVDALTGEGCTIDGTRFAVAHPVTLACLTDIPDARVVHLIGPRPGGDLAGFHTWRQPPPGWVDDGSYLEVTMLPVLRLRSTAGRRLDVQRVATWLGETDDQLRPTPAQCAAAWRLTDRVLRHYWHHPRRPVTILATPATTGRELAVRLFPDDGIPVQSGEVQDLIRATSGQGRIEIIRHDTPTIPGLYELDGRRMYTALVDRLPVGVATLHRGDHFAPYRPGRYHARWSVPNSWAHVGILPTLTADGWRWPATPGHTATGWVDAWEVQLARQHGWHVEITESLTWPAQQPKRGPLDQWGQRLRDAAQSLTTPRYATEDADVRALASTMLRAVALHAVGAFAGRPHSITHSSPLTDPGAVPADARNVRIDGTDLVWSTNTGQAWAQMAHPEWSAAIWARARVRLLDSPAVPGGGKTGALHLPYTHVLGFRTDAIYTSHDPQWPDDGKAGRFRLKPTANPAGPLPTPTNTTQLLALRDHPYTPPTPTPDRAANLAAIRTLKRSRAA